jgi:hypothetical protein
MTHRSGLFNTTPERLLHASTVRNDEARPGPVGGNEPGRRDRDGRQQEDCSVMFVGRRAGRRPRGKANQNGLSAPTSQPDSMAMATIVGAT